MNLVSHDLIIIGAGPAGLTAALYAGRSRLKTVVFEKMAVGGRILLTENIENFPGFRESVSTQVLIQNMEKQVKDLDIQIKLEGVLELDCRQKLLKTDTLAYSAKAIIIATGAYPRKLSVPGEERLTGKGVSYCATCDGPLYKEKDIVIVGGANAVAEEALYLARFAKVVSIIHRRSDLRASLILQERLNENKKIKFILNTVVTEIIGSHKVEGIKIKELKIPLERQMPCDGVFIYIGYEPETALVAKQLKMDEGGFIITQDNMATSESGIFACGDCRKKSLYQVITACADGAIAADSAYKYIAEAVK